MLTPSGDVMKCMDFMSGNKTDNFKQQGLSTQRTKWNEFLIMDFIHQCDFYWWFIMAFLCKPISFASQCPEGRVTGNLWPCGQYSFLVEFFQVQSLLLQLSVLEYHQLSTASADIFQLSGREWQHAETSNIWRKFHELPSTNRSISHRDMQIWIDLNTRANILVLQYK